MLERVEYVPSLNAQLSLPKSFFKENFMFKSLIASLALVAGLASLTGCGTLAGAGAGGLIGAAIGNHETAGKGAAIGAGIGFLSDLVGGQRQQQLRPSYQTSNTGRYNCTRHSDGERIFARSRAECIAFSEEPVEGFSAPSRRPYSAPRVNRGDACPADIYRNGGRWVNGRYICQMSFSPSFGNDNKGYDYAPVEELDWVGIPADIKTN